MAVSATGLAKPDTSRRRDGSRDHHWRRRPAARKQRPRVRATNGTVIDAIIPLKFSGKRGPLEPGDVCEEGEGGGDGRCPHAQSGIARSACSRLPKSVQTSPGAGLRRRRGFCHSAAPSPLSLQHRCFNRPGERGCQCNDRNLADG